VITYEEYIYDNYHYVLVIRHNQAEARRPIVWRCEFINKDNKHYKIAVYKNHSEIFSVADEAIIDINFPINIEQAIKIINLRAFV
jgi:hypothetical protein